MEKILKMLNEDDQTMKHKLAEIAELSNEIKAVLEEIPGYIEGIWRFPDVNEVALSTALEGLTEDGVKWRIWKLTNAYVEYLEDLEKKLKRIHSGFVALREKPLKASIDDIYTF